MVPSIAVTPRLGSFALALFGSTRNIQELSFFALLPTRARADSSAGRRSFVLKRMAEAFLTILPDNINLVSAKRQFICARPLELITSVEPERGCV